MNTSQSGSSAPAYGAAFARLFVVAGAVVGFTVLAFLLAGRADAAEHTQPAEPDRPGLAGSLGRVTGQVAGPVDRALRPETEVVHSVSAAAAPVVRPVLEPVEPVLAPVVRPVAKAAEPVLSALAPVTGPVTRPVVDALAPVTEPVTRAVGADSVVAAVVPRPVPGPRDDTAGHGSASSSSQAPESSPAARMRSDEVTVRSEDVSGPVCHVVRHVDAPATRFATTSAGESSRSDGGGAPSWPASPEVAGTGAMSAGSSGQHGGEYAVTAAGSAMPGSDRTWRAPPAGVWSLHWLEYYGNDHPS